MRRILDSGDRWFVQIVLLAYICASVSDTDAWRLGQVLPGVHLLPLLAMITLGFLAGAAMWMIGLLVLSWIAVPIGRMLGGSATAADVRAALSWALVPIVWSPIYRIPLVIIGSRFQVPPQINVSQTFLDFLSHGGCSFVVIFILMQTLFVIWCVVVGSFTLAEAQRFSTQKGFVNLAISLALPLLVIFAAVFTFGR